MPQELRAVGQKVALFTLCRARVLPGCSELETIPGVSAACYAPGPEPSRTRNSCFPSRKWVTTVVTKGKVGKFLRSAPQNIERGF